MIGETTLGVIAVLAGGVVKYAHSSDHPLRTVWHAVIGGLALSGLGASAMVGIWLGDLLLGLPPVVRGVAFGVLVELAAAMLVRLGQAVWRAEMTARRG